MEPIRAREMWWRLELIHAGVYFSSEAKAAFEDAGLKGYWMGYFASRSAPFGAATPEIVMATFYNFAERMVRRALPDAWSFSSPERVLAARLSLADRVLRVAMDVDRPEVAEAAGLAEQIARGARTEGRSLYAAHASLPWPSEPHLRLWHAATLLREHRGDGHIAALLTSGISGLQSHLLAAAAGAIEPATQRQYRGWTEEEWAEAHTVLRGRGILDHDAGFTTQGRTLKNAIESQTDELALEPYARAGSDICDRLDAVMDALAPAMSIPSKNPMGMPRS